MFSICIELSTKCKSCGNTLPINALTEKIICSACQHETVFKYEYWRETMIESAFTDGLNLEPGAGQNQTTMTGDYTFNLLYGNQNPRCQKCKTPLDGSKMDEFVTAGFAACTKCGNHVAVRTMPEDAAKFFEGVKYLAGEDTGLISDGSSGPVSTSKMVVFTCPSCAGNLEIDGSQRVITCKFCSSEIYLPDDLWLRLHPAKTVERWYLVFDEELMKQQLQKWENIRCAVADKDSNLYVVSSRDGDNTMIWSFGPDMKTRWIRNDLKCKLDKTGICITNDEVLFVFEENKHSLLKLSAADGSTLGKIEGEAPTPQNPNAFNVSACKDMICDSDGTIIAAFSGMLHRYSAEGTHLPMWGHEEHKDGFVTGLFKKLTGDKENDEYASERRVCELGNSPVKLNPDYLFLQTGQDGFLYLMDCIATDDSQIAKYSRDGQKLISPVIPIVCMTRKPFIDAQGNMFLLGTVRDKDFTNLVKFVPATGNWETVATDVLQGGVLYETDILAGTPDGKLYLFGDENNLRILDSSMKLIYISNEAKNQDKEAIEDNKDNHEDDDL